jgi:hypothetical protein
VKHQLVYVVWHDAIHPQGGWEYTKDIKPNPNDLTETAGWLVHLTDQCVQVAVTISGREKDDEQFTGVMSIPLCCVDSVEAMPFKGAKAKMLYRKPK